MIQLSNVSLSRGSKTLLTEVNLTVHANQKVAIVGANGAGKSTIFALLRGVLSTDVGDVTVPSHLKVGHLEQEVVASDQTALDYVIDGDSELRAIEQALTLTTDGMEIAELYVQMGQIDGYTAAARAAQLLDGLGFSTLEQSHTVRSFSGGWRMRLNLAKTLMCRADLLLLDEPTNHLDLDAIVWLEQWLKYYKGTLLFISHDRDFLDAIATHTVHLERQQLKVYTGNYSDFERQRAEQLALQQATFEKQQRQRAHLQSFIDRFKAKASKAAQAQSRIKALARMEVSQAAQVDSPFHFSFRDTKLCSNPLLSLNDAFIGYGEHAILSHINLALSEQVRIGLIGPNGAGKSTLIKCLMGKLPLLKGDYIINPALHIGYFDQHQLDSLDVTASAVLHLQRLSPHSSEQALRTYLGGFGFVGDQALTPVGPFSGGEKTRLALALLIWQKPNLLLLDEPTNHLDLEMRHALTMALQGYNGAMIVVSHDRHLLRSTTDTLWLVANQQVTEFKDDLDAYQQWLVEYRRAPAVQANAVSVPTRKKRDNSRTATTQHKSVVIEAELERQQARLGEIDLELADTALYEVAAAERLNVLLAQRLQLIDQIAVLEDQWLLDDR